MDRCAQRIDWGSRTGWARLLLQLARDRKSTRLNSSHTVIYTLSLHDALPIWRSPLTGNPGRHGPVRATHRLGKPHRVGAAPSSISERSEEHTSELQSHSDLHSFPTRRSSDLAVPSNRKPRSPWTGARNA